MGQSGNPGSHLNGSDQFVVGPCLMAPISSARTPSLRGHGEHYGGAEKNICWQGTIAKGGTPVCHARCISVGPTFPVIVTSYEVVMNDSKALARYDWKCLVVDEGHRLKRIPTTNR
jgi:hypothetical protein